MKTQRTIDNNKSAFVFVILLLPEFHCSRKLISIVSRSLPLPSLPRRRSEGFVTRFCLTNVC